LAPATDVEELPEMQNKQHSATNESDEIVPTAVVQLAWAHQYQQLFYKKKYSSALHFKHVSHFITRRFNVLFISSLKSRASVRWAIANEKYLSILNRVCSQVQLQHRLATW